MNAVTATGRGVLHVSHHQFWLIDAGQGPRVVLGSGNGLILVAPPGAALVQTGIHTGLVNLTVEAREAAPTEVDLGGWDEVVEVSLTVPAGRLRAAALMTDTPDEFPDLTSGPGEHRIRVHARGRDTEIDGVAHEPVEDYKIVVWPFRSCPEQAYKHTDTYGAELRQRQTPVRIPAPPAERPDDPRRALLDARLRRARDGH